MAQIYHGTGLIIQGQSESEKMINTDSNWKVYRNPSYSFQPINHLQTYYAVGPGEVLKGSDYPWNWKVSAQTDWPSAQELSPGIPLKSLRKWGEVPLRPLVPRELPFMELMPQQFKNVRRVQGIKSANAILNSDKKLIIPANTKASLLIDQGELTTAFPKLLYSLGKHAQIKITYSESLFHTKKEQGQEIPIHEKGNRNEIKGKIIWGNFDQIIADGGENRVYEPLWWRTFRYIQLDIVTYEEDLVLHHMNSTYTGYPLKQLAHFDSDNLDLANIYDISWRTQRLCAGESYFDCPYYEQLQYTGDTRVQAFNTLYAAGDTLLWRKSIQDYFDSRVPNGLNRARYPSRGQQLIPTYSLIWITMLWDYWMYANEESFIQPMLPAAMDIIYWFDQRFKENNLPGQLEGWQFVDWVTHEGWDAGVPPLSNGQESALIALQYVYTLQLASELMSHFGYQNMATQYTQRSTEIIGAVNKTCWDAKRGIYADNPLKQSFSQHTNILAILTDALPAEDQIKLFEKIDNNPSIAQCSYYFMFYKFEALQKVGLGDQYISALKPWMEMLESGLTTTMERPDPSRSDCHAWSASPLFHYHSLIGGIRSSAAGFSQVSISPNLGPLKSWRSSVPHRLGEINVKLIRKGNGLEGEVVLPKGLTGQFQWNEESKTLKPGANTITF